jgi:hypothetical protein
MSSSRFWWQKAIRANFPASFRVRSSPFKAFTSLQLGHNRPVAGISTRARAVKVCAALQLPYLCETLDELILPHRQVFN